MAGIRRDCRWFEGRSIVVTTSGLEEESHFSERIIMDC